MAKWGEGDPRWIVEERADATNVNNWHWTEKNATSWSKDKLQSLLIGLKVEGAAGVVELKDFATLEGEASASNRKGKLIFFYEWDIKINWKGVLNTEEMDEVTGTIVIPNLSDEQDICDIDVNVAVTEAKAGAGTLKEMVRTRGADQIREQLASYIENLKIEFSQGMILPTARDKSSETKDTPSSNLANEFKQASISSSPKTSSPSPSTGPVTMQTKKISLKEEFKCSKDALYRALTQQSMMQAFTRAPASVNPEVGGEFVLFNGVVTGEFQKLIPDEKIVQKWRMNNWPEGHYSIVTIKLAQTSNSTTLTLSQTGVPAGEVDRTKQGWHTYYWNSIRQAFGFVMHMF